MIDAEKLANFLLDINFKAEKLPDCQEDEFGKRAVLDVLEDIFTEIESGRLNK
jgi:hypothetical protein